MFVPVPVVGGMAMAVMDVVGVVTVGHRFVTAALFVDVGMGFMGDMGVVVALIPVTVMNGVHVTVMQVVDVVAVGDGNMAAPFFVGVGVVVVDGVGGHARRSSVGRGLWHSSGLVDGRGRGVTSDIGEAPPTTSPVLRNARQSDLRYLAKEVLRAPAIGKHINGF